MSATRARLFVWSRPTTAGVALACLLTAGGCGNGLAKLEGQVSVNGEPLRATEEVRGRVLFQPVSAGPSASGTLDADGRFEAYTGAERGLPEGEYTVTVSAVKVIPPKDQYSMPGAKKIIPRRYANAERSGLRVTVGPGSNEYDIDLATN